MGKPFAREIAQLPSSLMWATQAENITSLKKFVGDSAEHALIAVGSGGSLTAATVAAQLHQSLTGLCSRAMTPLEFQSGNLDLRRHAVLHVTAGGRNHDILDAYSFARGQEAIRQAVIVARQRSPLGDLAEQDGFTYSACFDLPTGKDGFLATNTLLATLVLILRTYREWLEYDDLPTDLRTSLREGRFEKVRKTDHLIALHGGWTSPVAIDLESKFSEAALGSMQLADYRNFGHGRHNWLAKRGADTTIVALVSPPFRRIAERTLSHVPSEVQVIRLETKIDGPMGIVDLLPQTFRLVERFGRAVGTDPGKPGIPPFGSKLYGLRASIKGAPATAPALARKAASLGVSRHVPQVMSHASRSLRAFVQRLARARITAMAFDYDGTLCDTRNRYDALEPEISKRLAFLLRNNIALGIATGRGKSVREELQKAIARKFWDQIVVGYYNGSQIAPLSDPEAPGTRPSEIRPAIERVAKVLRAAGWLSSFCDFEVRPTQITVRPYRDTAPVSAILRALLAKMSPQELDVVQSSHSIDLIPIGQGKLNLYDQLSSRAAQRGGVVLAIGDKGAWPGNDFLLLSTEYSLSVDEVSPALDSCWNLAPAGTRGLSATKYYLSRISVSGGAGRYSIGDPG